MNNSKSKVLVFPAGSEIGLEIERSLRNNNHFEVFGATTVSNYSQVAYNNLFHLPHITDPNFPNEITKLIREQEIDFVFPAHDDVVEALPKLKEKGLIPDKVIISGSSPFVCSLARSKIKTYDHLQGVVKVPKTFNKEYVDEADFPLFSKPDRGQGSKGVFKINNFKDLERVSPTDLVCEYLPGDEYTVDCFTDRHGILRFCQPRVRQRTSNGISVSSKEVRSEDLAEFLDFADKLNSKVRFRGIWFFQVKRNIKGELTLLEMAPRVAGGMGYSRIKGANLPLLSLYDHQEKQIEVFTNSCQLVKESSLQHRYLINGTVEAIYLDLDDTLILGTKVNSELIAKVYSWKNAGVKVFLLTRHLHVFSETVMKCLARHNICPTLFDDIIDVPAGNKKSNYIKEKSAIFVDDSHSERSEVNSRLGILVFDCQQVCEVVFEDNLNG
ncbi:ATP-grasp domain-containing protein [Marinobacter persicus]|uniref:ATP-grasp domain-containing protein n=1 Tax=Marinobacter persicus TaxID=930118 RepID=A0A2S6G2E6_9GAMM|nr:ATP-grasp domain-containing protein [Marinobacter persicus]PPK49983.1 ATP-grasp domain-containing protein [Marinobacter persicus]PPK51898.1 ATP-grasp domain-containing protein [Marinobacter persicus]PPK56565.1 ATP-grasp domain-containing protein [Marinobacter persicus]